MTLYYKMRQLFYYKMRQKFIKKYIRFFTKFWSFIAKRDSCYKMRRYNDEELSNFHEFRKTKPNYIFFIIVVIANILAIIV